MDHARRNPEPWRGGFEGGKQLTVLLDPLGQSGEFLRSAVGFKEPRRHAPKPGR
jgi:hypothetical protein